MQFYLFSIIRSFITANGSRERQTICKANVVRKKAPTPSSFPEKAKHVEFLNTVRVNFKAK